MYHLKLPQWLLPRWIMTSTREHDQDRPFLDRLFPPPPVLPPSALFPRTFPGIDQGSTASLIKALSDNHVRWHVFFNDKGYHNHAAHHVLALWALGAPGPVIEAAYANHCEYQRPAFASPEPINRDNLYKHLGDENYYSAYRDYYASELLQKGLNRCLEEYIFATEVNFGAFPEMLSRLVGGVLHPFIHVGNGAEFNSIGISAEGLAMSATQASTPKLVPKAWFLEGDSVVNAKSRTRTALSILALVSCDPRLSHVKPMEEVDEAKVLSEYGSIIHEYVDTWKFDVSTEASTADAVEELSWIVVLIYGVGGFTPNKPLNADFFSMHLVTSSIFLSSLLASIDKPSSRSLLLLAYLTETLTTYVSRGRAQLDIRSFYKGTEDLLHNVPGPTTEPAPHTLPTPTSALAQTPNAWYRIIQTAMVHPDVHLCKTQRALAHGSSLYGTQKKGWCAPEGEAEEKVGLKELDGTLFVRVARLTQDKLGWLREGKEQGQWDH